MATRNLGPEVKKALIGTVLLAMCAGSAVAATYTVGADPGCTHSSIAFALLSAALNPGPDEIRIAENQSYTNEFIHLTDWDPAAAGALTITGGYSDCTDLIPLGYTVIDGQAGNSTFVIDTTGANQSLVTLRNLEIIGSGIRGVQVEGNSTVTIQRCRVRNNGGGIDIEPGALVVVDFFTFVESNRGGFGQGGGIRCWGGSVYLHGVVQDNLATSGGGLFAGNGCTVRLFDGAFLLSNDATDGGGIYAEGDSDIWIDNSSGLGVRVDSNTATRDGGGVFATGATTFVDLGSNVSVNDNQAANRGGGIYVDQLATVKLDRYSRDCEDPVRCTTLSGNSVTVGWSGAAGWVDVGGTLEINQAYIEDNQIPVDAAFGSILHAIGSGAGLKLESVVFWNNHGPDTLMEAREGATVLAGFVTASGNSFNSGAAATRPIVLATSGTGELYSSIFWPNSQVLQSSGGVLNVADCVIVSNTDGLPIGGLVTVVDPLFRDAAGGDLHLRVESPAVDHCDTVFYIPSQFDIDYEPRGYDLAENPNGAPGVADGVFDIGFDEVRHFFYDGFESGDTSRWSSTSP